MTAHIWTTVRDIRLEINKIWDKGLILTSLVNGSPLFPLKLRCKIPNSSSLSEHFEDVRLWISQLAAGAKTDRRPGYRLVWREFNHRILGNNQVPIQIWIDTIDDALALVGKQKEVRQFQKLIELTRQRFPNLLPWIAEHPMRALGLVDDWEQILDIVAWMQSHPCPGIYLRQVSLPGLHTKFIESHRNTLSELFDKILPSDAISLEFSGTTKFARRYGFRDKPQHVRFRILDDRHALLESGPDHDMSLASEAFARLRLRSERVFVTENEINYLAFPKVENSIVIFGAGYGFEIFEQTQWLCDKEIYYWGDIDTHGFAILDQFRSRFPATKSILMDRDTLVAHRTQWSHEPRPSTRCLIRLTSEESQLYQDLGSNQFGKNVRLEQERIDFGWLEKFIENNF